LILLQTRGLVQGKNSVKENIFDVQTKMNLYCCYYAPMKVGVGWGHFSISV